MSDLLTANRNSYLDLLREALLNTIYGDPSNCPFLPDDYDPYHRAEGLDWPSQAHTMIGRHRLDNIRFAIETVLEENIPGHCIETGVWRGGACIFMRGVLKAYGVTDRTVFVCDSFEGLPPPNEELWPADNQSKFHEQKELAVSHFDVVQNFRRYNLMDNQVKFVEGYFEDTLPGRDFGKLAVARLDGDMYGSTMVALRALYPQISPGGFVIIDDYNAVAACHKAVDDFRAGENIDQEVYKIDRSGIYWRK